MTFTFDELKLARERGYSDDEIWNTLASEDKEIGLAKQRGYSLEEVASITSGQPIPELEPERREGGGIVGGAADIGIQFMKGLGTGTRMISDVFGANNPVSKTIAGYEDYFDSLLSAESKQDSQEISRILKEAEGKGILPQIMAGLEAFTVAPAEMTASTMGMMLPNLAGGVYSKAAQLTKAGVIGLQMGIGAAQGAGSIKGQIYTAVQEELRRQGLPEDKIDDIATEAQAYNGKNLDQILIGAGLGAAASSTGAEKIMTRLITGAGKEASEDIIKAVIKGGFSEAPIEGLQGGQEQIAQNVALQRIGVDVPTMQGVIPAATMEATAGLVIGGGFGGVEALTSPEQNEEKKIDKQSNQVANELLAENTPATQSVVKELARRENAVTNLQEAYDALEPTSQEAQKLKLELSEAQRNLSAFKEVANKAGLSETITEAEKQQIELAKAITEPAPEVAVPVTEAITPPAEVAPTAPAPQVVEGLQAVSENTATPTQLTELSQSGLVDIVKGQPVINEEGQAVLTQAEAPLPKLTPEERRAEIEEQTKKEPFGKLPTAEVETALSQRAKEAAIAEEREKIEAPIRRQESINQFLSEGATVKSRTNVVGRKKAAEGGGDIIKTAYYLAHPDGKREIPLSQKEASDLKAPAPEVAPAPIPAPKQTQEDVKARRYSKFLGESAPQAISEAKNALSTFKTTMLGKRGDSPFQAEPRLRELKNTISLFVANRLSVTNQKADEIAEQIILGKPNIIDKVTELKPIKAKELDDIGAIRSSITRFGYELDDKKTYRHPREGEVTTPTPAVSETITPAEQEGKRYNPLGYDIADVVEDVKAGKTDTPLRAINQVVEQANQFRDRVKAESQRRQQPRKRGKAAILERVARERSAGNITEKTAQALTDFVNRIREDAIGDTAISIREKGVSNFDFADNLVTFFLNQDKGNLGMEVAVHEFWHGLSRFLPETEVEQINKDYVRELEAYLKKNPWFLAFVGRYTLTPEQYEAYKFFNPKEAETKLTPVLDERGNIIKYKIKFDKDNYRYIMLDEFIAEKMTDLVLGKQAIPNTFLGKLAKVFREFLALIKSKLGIDPYEKFYQLVTDTNERLTLQRESGVAPPIQIYEPQEYDYSTRRMMAVEPEPKTITEGFVQGLDIGKETNMPINNKIESHIKNFAFVRGIFESASDRLRRAKFTKLATAIDDYYDQAQRRLGFANKILLPAFDEYSKQSKSTKKRIDEEVKMFFAAQENKRDTDEFFDELNPITQKIVTAWQKFGEESGKENQRIGIKVFDRGLQRWRPIGRVEKFWPRVLKPEYKRALMEPDKYQKEYNEIVEALMKSGRINTPEEAEVFISDYQGTGSQNDYFSGIEAARGQAFPEELYDYSMQVMTDYVARWAQHSSRIEQFGQKLGENSKTLWDRSRESTRDRRTIDYITAAQERVEGYYPNDPIVKGMATLNIWSSGLQLGNPASSMLNFFGGTTLNAMVGQPGAFSSYLSSFVELRKLGRELKDAREKGIVSRDLMNIIGDHQVVLESNGLAKAGQKTTDFLLKWSGFTPIEQMVRTQSMIIGKSFLRKTLSSLSKNPNSSFSKRALTWLNRNNIDADKLIVEQGTGPETDKLLRYFANISQGSYTISQTPIFTDTPIGRFLFKYQKFSTQVMRQSWKNTFEPAWRAVTNKNETLQLPDPTRQLLYRLRLAEAKELGDNRKITLDEIPKKVTKAEGKALTIIPVMMWLGSAYVGGEVILRLRDMLFGVLMKGPDYEDIIRAFEDDEDDDELYLSLERAWYNLIGMGALGLIGNYAQFFMDWQDRERVKNPLDPPALSIFKETATFIQNAVDQGKITIGDLNNYLNRTFSAYRVSQRLYQTAASGLGYSKAPTVAEEIFRREVASINKYARRWAESAGLEYRTKRPMDIAPSKMTSINREIASYLQRGEPGAAAAYAKEYLNSLPKKERANAIQSMESGARNRQPLRLGSGPMDQAEKIAFKKWLKEKVSKEKFDEIQKLESQYQKNYNIFLNNLPNK